MPLEICLNRYRPERKTNGPFYANFFHYNRRRRDQG